MALTGLDLLLANADGIGFKLIPHVEEAALKYAFRSYVMASRVAVKTDMSGWNVRKISEYLPSRRAQELQEDTAIPDTSLVRTRKATIEPKEVGERYRISDRRADTDLASILADTVQAIGKSIGDRIEVDLMQVASDTFRGGTLGSASNDYDLPLMLQAATLFRQRAKRGQLFHVIHPFQALPVMEKLIEYSGANAQAALAYRDAAVNRLINNNLTEFDLPTFGNVNLAIGEFVPRRVIFKLAVLGDGGTFRLQLGDGYVEGTNITAAITVSTTAATMVTNINNAIAALPLSVRGGTWVASGSDIADLTITPPADFYIDDEANLRVAVKYDEDATLNGGAIEINLQKSAYDLVTNPDGSVTDMNGVSVGVTLNERSATARGFVWQREAIIMDIRKSVKSFFELTMQGRTAEYSGYMTYGAGQWSPEKGMFILSKATSPVSVV